MRKALDLLYDGAAALAALCMIGRWRWCSCRHRRAAAALQPARHRRLRRLPDGRRGLPGAGAHPQARRAHPRHAGPVERWARRRGAGWSAGRWARGAVLALAVRLLQRAAGLAIARLQRHLHRQRRHRRCGFRSCRWRWARWCWPSPPSTSSCSNGAVARRRTAARRCAMNDVAVARPPDRRAVRCSWAAACGSASRSRA